MAEFKQRRYDFASGFGTSTLPDAGSPTLANHLITLSYAQAYLDFIPTVTGPTNVSASGLTYSYTSGVSLKYVKVATASGAVTVTNNPQISAGTSEGYSLVLLGTSDSNYPIFNDGNGLKLNGECMLKEGSMLGLIWLGSTWVEAFRNGI